MFKDTIDFAIGHGSVFVAVLATALLALSILRPQAFDPLRARLGIAGDSSNLTKLLLEALEKVPQAICIFGGDKRLLVCNKRYATLPG